MARTPRVADAVFYLLRSGCAWRMRCPENIHHGRRSTTTSVNGASMGGCAKPTTGCLKQCARRKGAPGTRAER